MTAEASVSQAPPKKSAARLAAVQALYVIESTEADPTAVLQDFVDGRLGGHTILDNEFGDDVPVDLADLDSGILTQTVRGALARAEEIEAIIQGALSDSWPYERLEVTLKCILRAALSELLAEGAPPAQVVITEYVQIAHAFYDRTEAAMVNAVLDKAARALGRLS